MSVILPYSVGVLVALGLFALGALWGSVTAERRERQRCGDLVKDHLCSECYTRHCFLKLASQIQMRVVNDPVVSKET